MKRWVRHGAIALSAVLCLAGMVMWGDSYRTPRTLRHERFPPEGRPWKLRTVALTTAEGSIEFSVMREHVYLAKDQEMREGFSSEVYPDVVLARERKLG